MSSPLACSKELITSVDLSELPASRRFDFWSDVICKNFSPSENSIDLPSGKFTASLSGREIGPLGLCTVVSSPMVSSRTAQSLRQHPLDHYFVSLLTSGSAVLTQNGRDAKQEAGDLLMYDSARPFTYRMTSCFSGTWLCIPRHVVEAHMAYPDALSARVSPTTTPLGRMLATMLEQAASVELPEGTYAVSRLANAMIDVLAAVLESQGAESRRGNPRHVNMLDKAKTYMLANLADPNLDTDALVNALGTSRRTLNRMFAHEGSTPIRWLWQKRLERSRSILENGTADRITNVALSCGFSDFSHFSRSFKAHFGVTPRKMLSA